MKVTIRENTIIQPVPTIDLLQEKERKWRLHLPDDYKHLPDDYKSFIMKYNGAIPDKTSFVCDNHSYVIERFLCILKNASDNQNGWYDISVVESQIGERLTSNEDLIGVEVLPIAALFAGDYLCLDFREKMQIPEVCVWSHDESEDLSPITYKIADSFSAFLEILC